MTVTTGAGNPDINSAQVEPEVRAAAIRQATVEALQVERAGWERRGDKDRVKQVDAALAELVPSVAEPAAKRTAAPARKRTG